MTQIGSTVVDDDLLSGAYRDIARLLESREDSDERVTRVLERLRSLVPYELCAVLQALPGSEPRLITPDETPPPERDRLRSMTTTVLDRLMVANEHACERGSPPDSQIAVPLVSMDEVVGILFVEGAAYTEAHLLRLEVVAAKFAAYFALLSAAALEAERTRELARAWELAETANRAKDEFLASVSHELRTPLNTILAWADALRSSEARDDERLRAFEAIVRGVRAEVSLIDDLLDLSCTANATLCLDLRAVEPAKLIRATLRGLQSRAEQKAIRLEAKLDESVTCLMADPQRLRQVLVNLVANAIKFTPVGGRVEVRLERAGILARIQVRDTGAGIRPELLPNLFERFRTEDGSSTRAHPGLGLGLALVKDLVELHGGKVRAESPGEMQGSTFTVELPFVQATSAIPPSAPFPERQRRPVRRPDRGAFPPPRVPDDERALAGVRVLLVDDDSDICEVLQFVLEDQGAVVSVAGSAEAALAALEGCMPNVLISDLAMPGQTGHDLMRTILARKGSSSPPAAALSAYARGHALPEALASGFQMLLSKPIDPEVLINAVRDLAGVKAARGSDSAPESERA